MKEINVGLLGCGTVGTGVAKMLLENGDIISSRVGTPLTLKRVADIDVDKDRGIRFDPEVFITDARQVVNDPEIDIIVEMIGGEGIANELIIASIQNGKQVVTANKALLAKQGNALFQAAEAKGVDLAFEASVGGCMPVVKTLRESLVGNNIHSIIGILNGTCNYILTKITDEKRTFKEALAEAQAKGFAEVDPKLDIEGHDTAHNEALPYAPTWKGGPANDGRVHGVRRSSRVRLPVPGVSAEGHGRGCRRYVRTRLHNRP